MASIILKSIWIKLIFGIVFVVIGFFLLDYAFPKEKLTESGINLGEVVLNGFKWMLMGGLVGAVYTGFKWWKISPRNTESIVAASIGVIYGAISWGAIGAISGLYQAVAGAIGFVIIMVIGFILFGNISKIAETISSQLTGSNMSANKEN